MAKKGQTVQLQTELNTDEEWEKYIQKPGLLVIDIYSDWCGPCVGMQANLKKIKVEIGGDTLQLAIAKCDTISALARFRGTSEPTWMLVSNGKIVNFMYGADAPKLTKIITEELRIQKMVEEGSTTRELALDISQRAPEEAIRYNAIQKVITEETQREAAKKQQEIHQRLLKESDAILENLGNLGIIVILPHARDKYMEVLKDLLNEAGLVISISEKLKITKEHIEGISYFLQKDGDLYLREKTLEHMYQAESQLLVIKAGHGSAEVEDPVSVRVQHVIYGADYTCPPGEEGCPYRRLLDFPADDDLMSESRNMDGAILDETEVRRLSRVLTAPELTQNVANTGDETNLDNSITGVWTPPTRRILSSCFKIFLPKMAEPLLIPEPPPKPPYIAVCYPIDKRQKVQELMSTWNSEIERYGIFSSIVPEEAKLIAKSFKKYDKSDVPKDGNEKIVIQLARKRSECLLAFALEFPTHMSPNIHEGKRECKIFFPEKYDEPPEAESEVEEEGVEVSETASEIGVEEPIMDVEIEEHLSSMGAELSEEEGREKTVSVISEAESEATTVTSIPNDSKSEKSRKSVALTREIMEEILYFSDAEAGKFHFEENPKKPTLGILLKRSSENLPSDVIDDVVLQVVYGNSRKHPGDENSPSAKFLKTDPDNRQFIGLWAPPNTRCKALALKLLFPSLSKSYTLPEIKHESFHVAMAFDVFKMNDLVDLMNQYPGGVIRFGFFTSDDPTQAELISKTVEEFTNRTSPPTYEEKMFLQVSKENQDSFMALLQQGPSYRSANVDVGEADCKLLFPPGYDVPPKEEVIVTKKSKKKKAKVVQHIISVNDEGEEVIQTMIAEELKNGDDGELKTDNEEVEGNDDDEDDEENEDETAAENEEIAEKATSPMEEI